MCRGEGCQPRSFFAEPTLADLHGPPRLVHLARRVGWWSSELRGALREHECVHRALPSLMQFMEELDARQNPTAVRLQIIQLRAEVRHLLVPCAKVIQ